MICFSFCFDEGSSSILGVCLTFLFFPLVVVVVGLGSGLRAGAGALAPLFLACRRALYSVLRCGGDVSAWCFCVWGVGWRERGEGFGPEHHFVFRPLKRFINASFSS